LVKEKSELVIPVSCTEQGRWSYQTDEFFNSENFLPFEIRANKAAFVSNSLKEGGNYHSDQGAIWDDIAEFSVKFGVHSATGAMKDIFEGKKDDLEEYIQAFPCLPSTGQGLDYRFEGQDKVGSALVYLEKIIHLAFFKLSKEERIGRMSGYKRRRG
jgi:hypothetical protein